MRIKSIIAVEVSLLLCGVALAQGPPGVQIRTTRSDATVTMDRSLADGRALVGVADARKGPVLGLSAGDFTVVRAGETGKVVSVEPISKISASSSISARLPVKVALCARRSGVISGRQPLWLIVFMPAPPEA